MEERFTWNEEKNRWLIVERQVSFVQVVAAIHHDRLAIIPNPNQETYPGQQMFVVEIDDYAWVVPADRTSAGWFLHTAYPNRTMTRRYLGKE